MKSPRLVAVLLPCLAACLSYHRGAMPGEPRDATYASVRQTRVRYIDEGEGPAVILIHGFASSLETWDSIRPELRKHHRVLAFDLKGFGWTDRPPGNYSPHEQARIVRALMDARGIERAAVVAHSYGAAVTFALAKQAPERVERIALYDAFVYEEQTPVFFEWAGARGVGETLFALFYGERPEDRLARAFYDPERIPQELIDAIERAFDRPGTRAAALSTVRSLGLGDAERDYRSIEQPTLLLWGRDDVVTPVRYGEKLATDLRNADLAVFPRCGHFPMIEATHASTARLVSFLSEGT